MKSVGNDISIEYLKDLLLYNPETGTFVWKERPLKYFKDSRMFKSWNTRYAHKPAGSINKSSGYIEIRINGKAYLAHRLAYAIYHGKHPTKVIDHIDGNKLNNIITNLRDVTISQNSRNSSKRTNNTSGKTGVSYCKRSNKWFAYAGSKNTGTFEQVMRNSFEEALEWRKLKEITLNINVRE